MPSHSLVYLITTSCAFFEKGVHLSSGIITVFDTAFSIRSTMLIYSTPPRIIRCVCSCAPVELVKIPRLVEAFESFRLRLTRSFKDTGVGDLLKMLRKLHHCVIMVLGGISSSIVKVNASFNYSDCAARAFKEFSANPGNTLLVDQDGKPTTRLDDAWGINYPMCHILCGTRDNAQFYDWKFLAQGISSWLIPWLALSAQLPFETKNKTTNLFALLLTLGSPALAVYSLALTLLNARRINQKFRHVKEENQWLHRPLQIKAIKAARSILIETQHVPIQVYNGRRREISQLIVHPKNWAWWCSLRQELLKKKRQWTYSLYAQVGWVCVSQLLAIIDFFTTTSRTGSSIDIGLSINSLWIWMIPTILGWVYVGTQNSAASIKAALIDTDVPTLGSESHFKGECIGLRDRTTYDQSSPFSQNSSKSNGSRKESRQVRKASELDFSASNSAAIDTSLETEQEYATTSASQEAYIPHHTSIPLDHSGTMYARASKDIELQAFAVDHQIDQSSTLQANEQEPQPAFHFDSPFDLLPQTFMNFSIAGDDIAPGPIYNYARVWTHTNAIDRIADSFLMSTSRQQQRETVHGHEFEPARQGC